MLRSEPQAGVKDINTMYFEEKWKFQVLDCLLIYCFGIRCEVNYFRGLAETRYFYYFAVKFLKGRCHIFINKLSVSQVFSN